MSKSKHYSRVYNRSFREWNYVEISSLIDTDWMDWIKDRLHQTDGLPGPNVRIDEAWEDIFLMIIPQLKDRDAAMRGITLAYQDAINNINDKWRLDAIGALILLVRILIVQGNSYQQTEKIREMTAELLKKVAKPILDNKARDPYTQATYLINDLGKQYKEKMPTNIFVIDAWNTSSAEPHS